MTNTPVPDLNLSTNIHDMDGFAEFNEDGQVEACVQIRKFDDLVRINMDVSEMKQLRNWLNLCIESAEKRRRETL
jgi:hypothetical protein